MAATTRFMTHTICRPTAKNWYQLRDPMLGNHAWATFAFLWNGIAEWYIENGFP